MQQRIELMQLDESLSSEDIELAQQLIHQEQLELDGCPEEILHFCRSKIELAAENITFFVKQSFIHHQQGYPSSKSPVLQLSADKLTSQFKALRAFYDYQPGLIWELESSAPDVLLWFVLDAQNLLFSGKRIETERDRLIHLFLFQVANQLPTHYVTFIFAQVPGPLINILLAKWIEGGDGLQTKGCMYLASRQGLSQSLVKHWVRTQKMPEKQGHAFLSLNGVSESTEWLEENSLSDNLFELLLAKQEKRAWMRRNFEISYLTEEQGLYARMLDFRELEHFDLDSQGAPMHLVIGARFDWCSLVLEHLQQLSEPEIWLEALYVIYGDKLPCRPSQLDIDYDFDEVCLKIEDWIEQGGHLFSGQLRMGDAMNFSSTIEAMRSEHIGFRTREWLWRQICLLGCIYVPWSLIYH
ncbi:hypothetical protein [Vibrio mexicanus]|uniref:hypothetical protein n=1 Tax=Vibrio mexicanus TaxID=1004326 RepID=UPI00063C6DD4|nr:hypothetical protein [Vibrio mexicanus]